MGSPASPRSPFIETEALLLALEDAEADSGNHEPLDEYLESEFLPGELAKLEQAADLLSYRAGKVKTRKRQEARDA